MDAKDLTALSNWINDPHAYSSVDRAVESAAAIANNLFDDEESRWRCLYMMMMLWKEFTIVTEINHKSLGYRFKNDQ